MKRANAPKSSGHASRARFIHGRPAASVRARSGACEDDAKGAVPHTRTLRTREEKRPPQPPESIAGSMPLQPLRRPAGETARVSLQSHTRENAVDAAEISTQEGIVMAGRR